MLLRQFVSGCVPSGDCCLRSYQSNLSVKFVSSDGTMNIQSESRQEQDSEQGGYIASTGTSRTLIAHMINTILR